jgi:hypothetical protein
VNEAVALDAREAPSCSRRLFAGGRVLSVLRVESRAGIAASAQASPGKEGGSLFRERGTSSSIFATQRRDLQDVVSSCTQDRDAARRTLCSSLE